MVGASSPAPKRFVRLTAAVADEEERSRSRRERAITQWLLTLEVIKPVKGRAGM